MSVTTAWLAESRWMFMLHMDSAAVHDGSLEARSVSHDTGFPGNMHMATQLVLKRAQTGWYVCDADTDCLALSS